MKDTIQQIIFRLDRRHIQLLIVIVALSMFVLGAGAPGTGGGPGIMSLGW